MTLFDIILIVIIAGFIFYGLFFGLVHALGGLTGVFAGTIVAGWLFEAIGEFITPIFWGNEMLAKIVAFIIIFIIINRLFGLAFWLVDKVINFLKVIPFLKSINGILGGIFGFLEGVFLLGGILYIASRYPVWEWLNNAMIDSDVARYLVSIFDIIAPLLPEAVRMLQSLI